MYVSVVLPIHNERDSLPELCERLAKILVTYKPFEIIAINDGSTDDSLTVLKKIQDTVPELKVIELSRNYGQTAALAAGIDTASGEVIITMDSDLQHAPEDIPRFLAKLREGFDIVSGWREVRTDNAVMRRFPSFCANRIARLVSGVSLRDFGSTFKAYRSEVAKRIELFGDLHRFLPILAQRDGARVVEIPIPVLPRTHGKSNYGLNRTFGVIEDLVFLLFYTRYLTRPIRAFGQLFFLFFGAGFLISFVLMALWAIGSISAVREHGAMLLLSVFLMIVGVQFLVTGVLAEILSRVYMNTSATKIYSIRNIYSTSTSCVESAA